jgi:hypothetical protein
MPVPPRRALACALAAVVCTAVVPPARARGAPDPAPFVRPVPGPVVRPFAAPASRYGAGHRGVDFAAPAGSAVAAVGAGRVTFAGRVGTTLHVTVDHGSGLRTSLSFLATVTVRRGAVVGPGQVVGTAGGTGPEHDGTVVHLGARVGNRYVDPMRLFGALDLARVVRLAPVRGRPGGEGYETPTGEARSLADALRIPRGFAGLGAPEPEPDLLERVGGYVGGAVGDLWDAGSTTAGVLWDANRFVGRLVVRGATFVVDRTPVGAAWEDVRAIGGRLVDHVRSRGTCSDTTAPGPGGGGSGHLVFAVGGINSVTDPATGSTFGLDTRALGYHDDEVGWYSYARDGGPYDRSDTWGDLVGRGRRLRDQLRTFAARHPGREVDLVAHSQGGLVVDAFLQLYFDPADPTLPPLGDVVTLASPHQGAPVATVAGTVRATPAGRAVLDRVDQLGGGALPPTGGISARQLAEGSALVHRLWRQGLPEQIDLRTFGATDDAVVPPPVTRVAGAQTFTVDPDGLADHSAIVDDPGVMTAVRLALERRPPPCVGWFEGVRGAVEPVLIRRLELSVGDAVARALDPAR